MKYYAKKELRGLFYTQTDICFKSNWKEYALWLENLNIEKLNIQHINEIHILTKKIRQINELSDEI